MNRKMIQATFAFLVHIIATPEKTTRINYAAFAVLVVFSFVAIFNVRKAIKNGRWLRGD